MTDIFHFAKRRPTSEKKEKEIVKKCPSPSSSDVEYDDGDGKKDYSTIKKTTTDLPDYPLCKTLYGGIDEKGAFLTCIEIFRELENHTSQVYLRKRLSKAEETGLPVSLYQYIPIFVWSNEDGKWDALDDVTEEARDYCVYIEDLTDFIQWAQLRTRKPLLEKQRLFRKFNIELNEELVKNIKVPIENSVLDLLQRCLPFKMETQYRVGKYRLDAFIPRLRLGIQIDEHGHKNYDVTEEKEYDEVVRDHNIVCLRFNPHEKYLDTDPGVELVRRVWERTLSPDFSTFRDKFKLI
jgi:very-short-patch-repair endonuclease